ncbi:ROK family transcriptional regulator [Hydrogenoanaerobacterium sp.]|uniref:ROK family transcriptional regulator n=1 Tax=Hydrogenoanaerobacterium sp. TaxID=2953763 RepID=UPI00289A6797|nr:ROK family transcriptional regulator [Hydrogenoanaerobacterium sp.]
MNAGFNLSDVKTKNRALILRLVATEFPVSRVELARKTGLTKTTSSKIVADLMDEGFICEREAPMPEFSGAGRKPIVLDIADNAPSVCGMLVKRGFCTVIQSDLKGNILAQTRFSYHSTTAEDLVDNLVSHFNRLQAASQSRMLAVGIAALGPVDIIAQTIANPPNFYGIRNLPLPELIHKQTGLPAYLMNDAKAGALAEKLYGNGKEEENFLYLHIESGIGAGYVLHHQVYHGDMGQSGELGHTTIDFSGDVCACGNVGCLELYSSLDTINQKMRLLSAENKPHRDYSWAEIVTMADSGDSGAIAALDEFCEYLARAVINAVSLMDIHNIIVGYESATEGGTLERLLDQNLNRRSAAAGRREIRVTRSFFRGSAPLVGSAAAVISKLFSGELAI